MAAPLLFEASRASLGLTGRGAAANRAAPTCAWDPAGAHLAVGAAQSVAIFDRAGRRLVQFSLPHAAAAPAPPPPAPPSSRGASASAAAAAGAAAAAAAAAAVAAAAAAAAEAPLIFWDPSGAALAALAPGGAAEAAVWLAATGELQRIGLGPEGPTVAAAAAADGTAAAAAAAAATADGASATNPHSITALAWLPYPSFSPASLTLALCSSRGGAQLYHPLRQLRGPPCAPKHPGGLSLGAAALGRGVKPRRAGVALAAASAEMPGGPLLVLVGNDKRVTVSGAYGGGELGPTIAAFGFRGRPLRLAVAVEEGGGQEAPGALAFGFGGGGGGSGGSGLSGARVAIALTTTKEALWLARFQHGGQAPPSSELPMLQAALPSAYGAPTAAAWLSSPAPSWPPPLAVGFESGHVLVFEGAFSLGEGGGATGPGPPPPPSGLAGRLVRSGSIGGSFGRRASFGGGGGGGGNNSGGLSALDLAASAAFAPQAPARQQPLTPVASVLGAVVSLAHCAATGVLAVVGSAGDAALVPPARWRPPQRQQQQQQQSSDGAAASDIPLPAPECTPLGLAPGSRATCASWSADGQLVAVGTVGGGGGGGGGGGAGTGAAAAAAAAVFVARLPAVCAVSSTANVVTYLSSLREVTVADASALVVPVAASGRAALAAAAAAAGTTAAAPPAATARIPLECEASLLAVGDRGVAGSGSLVVAAASGHQAWFYGVAVPTQKAQPTQQQQQQPPLTPAPALLLRRGYPGRVLSLALGDGASYAAALIGVSDGLGHGRRVVLVHRLRPSGGHQEDGGDGDGAGAAVALPPLPAAAEPEQRQQQQQQQRSRASHPSSAQVTCLSANANLVVTGASDGSVGFYLVSWGAADADAGNDAAAAAASPPPAVVACVASWRHPWGEPLAAVSVQPGGVRAVVVDRRGGAFVVNAADGSAVELGRQAWGTGEEREGPLRPGERVSASFAAAAASASAASAEDLPVSVSVLWDASFGDVFAVAAVKAAAGPGHQPRLWASAYRVAARPMASGLAAAAAAAAAAGGPPGDGRGVQPLARVEGLPLCAAAAAATTAGGRAHVGRSALLQLGRVAPASLAAGVLAACGWAPGAGGGEGAPAPFAAAALAYGGGGGGAGGSNRSVAERLLAPLAANKGVAALRQVIAAGGKLETRGWNAAAAAAAATATNGGGHGGSAACWHALAAASLDALDCGTAAAALAEAGDAGGALAASSLAAEEWTLARGAFAAGLLLRLRPAGEEEGAGQARRQGDDARDAANADAVERLLLAARRPCAAMDMHGALGQWGCAVELASDGEKGLLLWGGGATSGGRPSSLPKAARRRVLLCRARRARQLEREGEHSGALELYKSALDAEEGPDARPHDGGTDQQQEWAGASSSSSSSSSSSDASGSSSGEDDGWASSSSSSGSTTDSNDDEDDITRHPLPQRHRACLSGLARCAARSGDAPGAVAAAERAERAGGGRAVWRRLAAELERAGGGGQRHAREAALCHQRAGDDLSAAGALVSRGELEAAAPMMARLAAAERRRRQQQQQQRQQSSNGRGGGDDDEGGPRGERRRQRWQQRSQRLKQLQAAYARALQDRGRHEEAVGALCAAGDVGAAVKLCWARADAGDGAGGGGGGGDGGWLARGCALLREHCGGGPAALLLFGPEQGPPGQEGDDGAAWLAPAAIEAARRCLLASSSSSSSSSKQQPQQPASSDREATTALEMLLLVEQDDRAFELAAARGLLPALSDLLLRPWGAKGGASSAAAAAASASSRAVSRAGAERLARLARYLERCGDSVRAADAWSRAGEGLVAANGAEAAEHAAAAAAAVAATAAAEQAAGAAAAGASRAPPPPPPVPWLLSSGQTSSAPQLTIDGPGRAVLLYLRAGTADAVERAIALAGARGWQQQQQQQQQQRGKRAAAAAAASPSSSSPRPLLPPVLAALGLSPSLFTKDEDEEAGEPSAAGTGGSAAAAAPPPPPPPPSGPLAALPPLAVERLRVLALAAAGRRAAASRRALRTARREQAAGRYRPARDVLLAAHLAVSPPRLALGAVVAAPSAAPATDAGAPAGGGAPNPPPSATDPSPLPPRELSLLLSLLHTYVLVRAAASRGDHRSAALLLLRLAPCAREHFPSHAAALLTSGVIECRRAGMRGAAYGLAEQLARPEHRASVPQAYRGKLARLLARGRGGGGKDGGDDGPPAEEPRAPCPCCGLLGPASQLDCAGCGSVVPYCVASGMRVTLADEPQEQRRRQAGAPPGPPPLSSPQPSRGRCPRCRFPCRLGPMRAWLAAAGGRCPMCDGEVAAEDLEEDEDEV